MLGAIGTSAIATTIGVGRSAAGLEARLAQYEIKLADWENCPSCKTAEGKAKIADLSGKVSEIKQRIAAAVADKEKLRPVALDLAVSANDALRHGGPAAIETSSEADVPGPISGQPAGLVGGRLDVFT